MSRIVVVEHLSLDGVMQAPGRADEDLRGGFEHGGWAQPYNDEIKGRILARGMAMGGPLLLGRRTYEDFYSVWPKRKDNPFSQVLDDARKYVASRTLTGPLPWKNSTLLEGDAAVAAARLRELPGRDIVVLGSGELVGSLARCNLVDEYLLLIHPLMLGSGRHLFSDGAAFARFRLVEVAPTSTGVVIATYRRAERTLAADTEAGARLTGQNDAPAGVREHA